MFQLLAVSTNGVERELWCKKEESLHSLLPQKSINILLLAVCNYNHIKSCVQLPVRFTTPTVYANRGRERLLGIYWLPVKSDGFIPEVAAGGGGGGWMGWRLKRNAGC